MRSLQLLFSLLNGKNLSLHNNNTLVAKTLIKIILYAQSIFR